VKRPTNEGPCEQQEAALSVPATGERFMPQHMSGAIELEHLHRYALACELAQGKVVLDIASGEGYGSYLLSQVAESVIGVDVSPDITAYAQSSYQASNLEFKLGGCDAIPVADHSIDLAVSFETIEHHDQHEKMLLELKRVLKANGILIISTPDKKNYSDLPRYKNEFHIKELYFDEFRSLLAAHFKHLEFHGQKLHFGSFTLPIAGGLNPFVTYNRNANIINKSVGIVSPVYIISLASDCKLPGIDASVFDGTTAFVNSLRDYEMHNAQLLSEVERIKATASWQITKPLRLLANLPRMLLRWWRNDDSLPGAT
jgi:O-antigen biosynthesis protein